MAATSTAHGGGWPASIVDKYFGEADLLSGPRKKRPCEFCDERISARAVRMARHLKDCKLATAEAKADATKHMQRGKERRHRKNRGGAGQQGGSAADHTSDNGTAEQSRGGADDDEGEGEGDSDGDNVADSAQGGASDAPAEVDGASVTTVPRARQTELVKMMGWHPDMEIIELQRQAADAFKQVGKPVPHWTLEACLQWLQLDRDSKPVMTYAQVRDQYVRGARACIDVRVYSCKRSDTAALHACAA